MRCSIAAHICKSKNNSHSKHDTDDSSTRAHDMVFERRRYVITLVYFSSITIHIHPMQCRISPFPFSHSHAHTYIHPLYAQHSPPFSRSPLCVRAHCAYSSDDCMTHENTTCTNATRFKVKGGKTKYIRNLFVRIV